MHFNPEIHHRNSIRLKEYNYSSNGAYFVTICAHKKEKLFGGIENQEMKLNEVGQIVKEEWERTAFLRPSVVIDEFIIMPNHFHGIIWIADALHDVGATRWVAPPRLVAPLAVQEADPIERATQRVAPTNANETRISPIGPGKNTIGAIVGQFKSAVTKRILHTNPFFGGVWQRNYYERIIRNDAELNAIRAYIEENPKKWAVDAENEALQMP